MKSSESNIDLKRLKALLPEVVLGKFDCEKFPSTCAELYLQKFPTFLLFKPNGAYEFHYGNNLFFVVNAVTIVPYFI